MGRKTTVRLGVTGLLIWLTIAIASIVGYLINVFAVIKADDVLSTGLGVCRVVGLFVPPLGAFLGLFF